MAKKTVGHLNVKLTATTASFAKAMHRARATVKSFGGAVKRGVGKLLSFRGAILGAVGIGGIGYFLKQQAAAIDSLGKTARRLGITSEALAGFHHAAGLAGIDLEQFNKALLNMSVAIGEASMGVGEAKDALEALGIDYNELVKIGPEKSFYKITDALAGVTNAQIRTTYAADIFGKRLSKVINMVLAGRKAMDNAREEAEKFGLAISNLESKQVENMNDAWFRMTQLMAGFGKQIVVHAAPYMEALYNWLLDLGTAGEGAGEQTYNAFKQAGKAIAWSAERAKDAAVLFTEIRLSMARAMSGLGIEQPGMGYVVLELEERLAQLEAWTPGKDVLALFEKLEKEAKDRAKERFDLPSGIPPFEALGGTLKKSLKIGFRSAQELGIVPGAKPAIAMASPAIRLQKRQLTIEEKQLSELEQIKRGLRGGRGLR